MKNDLLILYPNTFLWFNDHRVLIYESNSKQLKEMANNHILMDILLELNKIENLYRYELEPIDRKSKEICEFIDHVLNIKAGEIFEVKKDKEAPCSYKPLLNLQCDVNRLISKGISFRKNILNNLTSISLVSNKKNLYYNFRELVNFLDPAFNANLNEINISVLNFKEHDLKDFIDYLDKKYTLKILSISYEHVLSF